MYGLVVLLSRISSIRGELNILDKVEDRDTISDGTDETLTIGGKDDIALVISISH